MQDWLVANKASKQTEEWIAKKAEYDKLKEQCDVIELKIIGLRVAGEVAENAKLYGRIAKADAAIAKLEAELAEVEAEGERLNAEAIAVTKSIINGAKAEQDAEK